MEDKNAIIIEEIKKILKNQLILAVGDDFYREFCLDLLLKIIEKEHE